MMMPTVERPFEAAFRGGHAGIRAGIPAEPKRPRGSPSLTLGIDFIAVAPLLLLRQTGADYAGVGERKRQRLRAVGEIGTLRHDDELSASFCAIRCN